jgi:hypothetical protein
MSDDGSRRLPNPPKLPPRQAVAGELLFEVLVGHDRIRCELRDHGTEYGFEVQMFRNEEFEFSRRFDPRLDPTRRSRDLALQWADGADYERQAAQRRTE